MGKTFENEQIVSMGDFVCARQADIDLSRRYVVKGMLLRQETSVLYGPSNAGKSALVVHLGEAISTGKPAFGARVSRGMIIHVAAEAPKSIVERVQACGPVEGAAPYLVKLNAIDLTTPEQVQQFIEVSSQLMEVHGEKIALVVFDTLARSIGDADENLAGPMTRVADAAQRIARELDAHVMLVHHTGKDAERGGRGSSALRGAVDTELALAPQTDGTVVLQQAKQRTVRKGSAVQFVLRPVLMGQDEDGEDCTTVQVREVASGFVADTLEKSAAREKVEVAVLTALQLKRRGSTSSRPLNAPDLVKVLPREIFSTDVRESQLKAVRRALTTLSERSAPVVRRAGNSWELIPICDEQVRDGPASTSSAAL